VQGAQSVTVSISGAGAFAASLVGKDETNDLAVISILKADTVKAGVSEVTPAAFGDSDLMKVGDPVVAIGNALGEGNSLTSGVISAKNKSVQIDNVTYNALQTSAAINPGNSGGALVNKYGEVIGINSAKLGSSISTDTSVEGIGYAIPSNQVKTIVEELMGPAKPMLGISGNTINSAQAAQYNLPQAGVYVYEVVAGSAAAAAGLQPGDVITGFNGVSVMTFDALKSAVDACNDGDVVEIKYIRNGTDYETTTVKMTVIVDNSF